MQTTKQTETELKVNGIEQESPLHEATRRAAQGVERGISRALAEAEVSGEKFGRSNTTKVVLTLATGAASAKDFRSILMAKLGKTRLAQ